jgi:Flp pilus assembly pilin Flp
MSPDTPQDRPTSIRARLRDFHRDETGDEGVNKVLIIAMIAVPLLIALIAFGDRIVKFFKDQRDKLKKDSDANNKKPTLT